MTIITFIAALATIALLAWLINTYMPAAPMPLNIIRWVLNILLIIICFALLFQLIGWHNMNLKIN